MRKKISLYHPLSTCALLLSLATFSSPSYARDLGDINMPDEVIVTGTEVPLQLNGMGYRTKFIFKIYVGGLYTQSKVNSREAVRELQGPKRIVMHMIHEEVSREKMASAWREGFEENNTAEQLQNLQARLDVLINYFPDLKAGDLVLLDYIPGKGTRVTIAGDEKGLIAGEDFYLALLDVWLGDEPADDDLKDAMLGKDNE